MDNSKKKPKGTTSKSFGRPSKYKPEFVKQVYQLALLGATDAEISLFFEVDEKTLNTWKNKHSDFLQSGKMAADAEVASKLFKRALGYNYNEVTFEKIDTKANLEATSDGDLKMANSYKKKVVTKEVVPDVTAAIFWLKNRKRDQWRDKQDLAIDFDALTDEQLDLIIDRITSGQLKK